MKTNRRDIDQVKLNAAFAALRKAGYVARQRYLCCGGCAGAAIADYVEKSPKRSKIRGAVFYHQQDARGLKEGRLHIRYGGVKTAAHGHVGIDTAEAGKEVAAAFREAGLGVEWDGNTSHCLIVTAG